MENALRSTLSALQSAPTFDDAASKVLTQLLLLAETSVRSDPEARVLRGTAHLRPQQGYKGLVTVLHGGGEPTTDPEALRPSTTAWRWVSQHKSGAALDVFTGTLRSADGLTRAVNLVPPSAAPSSHSLYRLRQRETTHCLALPLKDQRDAVVGMVTLEATAMASVGAPLGWESKLGELQLLVDVASPHLLAKPMDVEQSIAGDDLLPVIGEKMTPLIRVLGVFAKQEETLLLAGPTGVGKSRLARWCHDRSARREGPCEIVNLLTVPHDMQMAELVGWRKGAFTGASRDQKGCVERAHGGTLFIDEVDKLSLAAQAGLLHLLEERKFRRLGDSEAGSEADVRFIVGTNIDLREAVEQGRFREDLYYRINVLPMHIPPLAERRGEVMSWSTFMLSRRHTELKLPGAAVLSADGALSLASQPWPGNLRQLDNVVRRAHAVALADAPALEQGVEVRAHHVRQALSFEQPGAHQSRLLPMMREVAQAFAAAALQAREQGAVLDLDHSKAFQGMVIDAAIELMGSSDEAFRMMGRESMLAGRNHNKLIRKARERVAELEAALQR